VLLTLGPAVDRIVAQEAPGVCLRFLPSATDDWVPLRDGTADLSVCILGHFPPEFRTRRLFTDRFVCVVRVGHPRVRRRLSLDQYLDLDHIVVSPLGAPSHVDRVLEARGLARRIRRIVPYFVSGLLLAANSDDALTVSDRAAIALAPLLGLQVIAPPLPLAPYALHLLWHPRLENEPANRWLRDVFVRAAREVMPEDEANGPERPGRRAKGVRAGVRTRRRTR
jgi:DNA-binding transcriptional LysR family regulator